MGYTLLGGAEQQATSSTDENSKILSRKENQREMHRKWMTPDYSVSHSADSSIGTAWRPLNAQQKKARHKSFLAFSNLS